MERSDIGERPVPHFASLNAGFRPARHPRGQKAWPNQWPGPFRRRRTALFTNQGAIFAEML